MPSRKPECCADLRSLDSPKKQKTPCLVRSSLGLTATELRFTIERFDKTLFKGAVRRLDVTTLETETRNITTFSALHNTVTAAQMKGDDLMKKLFLLHYSTSRRLAVGFAVLISMAVTVAAASASSLNTLDPAPILNAGWSFDQDSAVMAPSDSGPYVFTLASPAFFRITDQFIPGDVYDVFDGTTLILVTSFNGAQSPLSPVGDPMGQAGWTSAQFSHGQVLLAAGAHSISVEDTSAAFGIPAGFYARLDTAANTLVPEPATVVLLGIALTGVGVLGLRRRS